jgi:glyoxylase-like metal-dependent hydrolase (beta-lactamase superfamily II)
MRHLRLALLFLFGLGATGALQAQDAARSAVTAAAEAMGGVERIAALRTLRLVGYGNEAYQDGGSEITTEETAPEKVTNLTAYERTIDVANDRTRVRARMYRAFIFAGRGMMQGQPINQLLDGDLAFDRAANGAARRVGDEAARRRRMELLANPVVAVRTALAADSVLSNVRDENGATLVDVAAANGALYTLAIDSAKHLPRWVRWILPHENLGELTYRAEFSGWAPVAGLQLPMSFNTVSDFKDTVMLRLHVDRWVVDGDIDDLAAPQEVRAVPAPVPTFTAEATVVVPGVWLLTGGGANSVVLEFADHLTLFEVPTNRGWTKAVIDKARSLVPGKPLTQAIISHHHFDHTGGLRTAVAEGLTIVAQNGNLAWFNALVDRPVTHFPDALSTAPQALKTLGVDDHLRMSDSALTVDIYRTVANAHMAHGLLAYLPEHRLLIQGDLFDVNWEVYFWGNTYEDNIAYRDLDVERDVPIHGRVLPLEEVRAGLRQQTQNARDLCASVDAAGLSMPGCPLAWDAAGP